MNLRHIFSIAFLVFSTVSFAQKYKSLDASTVTKDWQGVTFTSTKSLQENLKQSPSFSFISEILKNETLVSELNKEEMVTVFVANNASFSSLDKEEREALLKDSNRLNSLVKFHTVPGRLDKYSIEKAISFNGGIAYFFTLEGAKLSATKVGEVITISDSEGHAATVKATDFYHKNGFFHMVEGFAFDTTIPQE